MSEFGHYGTVGQNCFLDSWGVVTYKIRAGGKTYTFEDSDRFGPVLLGRNGHPTGDYPDENSPFWEAWQKWVAGGRKTIKHDRNPGVEYCQYAGKKIGRRMPIVKKNIGNCKNQTSTD